MKKAIIVFVLGGILGSGAGFVGGIFFYPFIFLNDVVATETVQNADQKELIADGTFIHANPNDPIHYGKGEVTVFKDLLHLGEGFEVGPGPKYKVLLVDSNGIKNSGDVIKSNYIDLGGLRAFKGSQNYTIPASVDLSKFKSVVIWCETFKALISPADLKFKN